MKNILIIVGILALVGVGYFLIKPRSQETLVPRNPVGVTNEEVVSKNYKDYSKEEYEKALAEDRVIMLYFTANWCPICREQEPVNMEALEALGEDALALRIHILDSQETEETKALAEEYGVSYQHTFVFLDPEGGVSSKYTGPLTKEDLTARILAAKQ